VVSIDYLAATSLISPSVPLRLPNISCPAPRVIRTTSLASHVVVGYTQVVTVDSACIVEAVRAVYIGGRGTSLDRTGEA
jgi:hypothetical protein